MLYANILKPPHPAYELHGPKNNVPFIDELPEIPEHLLARVELHFGAFNYENPPFPHDDESLPYLGPFRFKDDSVYLG